MHLVEGEEEATRCPHPHGMRGVYQPHCLFGCLSVNWEYRWLSWTDAHKPVVCSGKRKTASHGWVDSGVQDRQIRVS